MNDAQLTTFETFQGLTPGLAPTAPHSLQFSFNGLQPELPTHPPAHLPDWGAGLPMANSSLPAPLGRAQCPGHGNYICSVKLRISAL